MLNQPKITLTLVKHRGIRPGLIFKRIVDSLLLPNTAGDLLRSLTEILK